MASTTLDKLKAILSEEYSSWLSEVAAGAEKQMLSNFDKEKDVNGNSFAPLKPSTVKERKSKGYGAGPILKRTKSLRNSIKVRPNMITKSFDIDYDDHAEYLNDGRSDMEPRTIIEFPDDWDSGGSEDTRALNKTIINLENRYEDFINIFLKEK